MWQHSDSSWQHLQHPPQIDNLPLYMRPKGNRGRIYHTISSVFSRKSSPVASSPESLLSTDTPAHLPEAISLSPQREKQRIYKSISSAFSGMSPPRAYSPKPFPSIPGDLPEVPDVDPGQVQLPEGESKIQGTDGALEVDVEGRSGDHKKQMFSDKMAPAQPQSESGGLLNVMGPLGDAKGPLANFNTTLLPLEGIQRPRAG